MSIEKLSVRVANFINNSPKVQKVFRYIGEHSAETSVKTSNTTNFLLRPSVVMLTGKNKLDSAYSATSSIASGIGETITSKTLLKGFNKQVDKSVEQLSSDGFFSSMSKEFESKPTPESLQKTYKSFLGRCCLIGLVFVNSAIKKRIHPPLAKAVNCLFNKKKVDHGKN